MTNVILCGGNGTRLWPLSREMLPKQFVKLFNGLSLFQHTLLRNQNLCDNVIAITNENHYFLMQEQKEEVEFKLPLRTIVEPVGRNTAPAIALAAMEVDDDEILLVTPSDHVVKKGSAYEEAVKEAKELASQGYIVTLGLEAKYPETGYGYIEAQGNRVFHFHEKPDKKRALLYVQANNRDSERKYYWNLGIFIFQAQTYLKELEKYAPDMYDLTKKAYEHSIALGNDKKIKKEMMEQIPQDSIDYAVAEQSDLIKMVPVEFEWSDLGSFDAVAQELDSSKIVEYDAQNNFAIADKEVVLVGVEDLIVVDTPDALLITRKGASQKVKDAIKKIENPRLLQYHTKVYRPWGSYEVLIDDKGYKIKRIVVKPGKRLSLQKHFHRNEHWIVVSGTAQVQIGDKVSLVRPNESTYIKIGEVHRLSNPGKIPVVLIEAQVGEYLEEDDIIRLADDFQRDKS